MKTTVIELPERVFDASGDCIDRRYVGVVVLDGVTLNGSFIEPRDFDSRGRLTTA